jgi:hypothetical protein
VRGREEIVEIKGIRKGVVFQTGRDDLTFFAESAVLIAKIAL